MLIRKKLVHNRILHAILSVLLGCFIASFCIGILTGPFVLVVGPVAFATSLAIGGIQATICVYFINYYLRSNPKKEKLYPLITIVFSLLTVTPVLLLVDYLGSKGIKKYNLFENFELPVLYALWLAVSAQWVEKKFFTQAFDLSNNE